MGIPEWSICPVRPPETLQRGKGRKELIKGPLRRNCCFLKTHTFLFSIIILTRALWLDDKHGLLLITFTAHTSSVACWRRQWSLLRINLIKQSRPQHRPKRNAWNSHFSELVYTHAFSSLAQGKWRVRFISYMVSQPHNYISCSLESFIGWTDIQRG